MIDWKKIRAVIFDLDGTLIDSMEIWREVDEEFFARRGMQVPEGYQAAIAHLGFRECAAYTIRNYMPTESADALVEEWRALSMSKYGAKDGAKYFKAQAADFVRLLRAKGMKLCVATASSPEFYLPVLRAGGIDGLFDAFVTVEDAGKNKSFPDIFLKSAEKLGADPSECIVFEDNLAALLAAKKAGMQTAAVYDAQTAAQHAQLRREADEFVETFGQMIQEINGEEQRMYKSKLSLIETEKAIKEIKTIFEKALADTLNLTRISAPLFVTRESGLNDNLNGVERPVSFDVKATGETVEVVHSLAKWKRYALAKYRFGVRFGLYTDMNAIRRDEDLDNLHSIYVDQWDWECVIRREDRTIEFLKETVRKIYGALLTTAEAICREFPQLDNYLSEDISFVTTQELEDMYPGLTPKQRETEYVRKHGSTFIMQIGGRLKSGKKHDGRAPDYDDWNLNGDIMLYYPVLDCAFEISSMGIRVDEQSLVMQLNAENCADRLQYPFHKALVAGELPLTMGGGIGQSRLCMFLLNKLHIGEVQVSLWDKKTEEYCKENHIPLM